MKSLIIASTFVLLTPLFAHSATEPLHGYTAPLSDWKRSSSLYEVPVPDDLKDVALFEISDVRVRTRDGVEQIKYNLPLELTGVENRIRLSANGDGTYSGAHAEATCSEKTCSLKYRDLKFDEAAVRDLFKRRGIEDIELDRRMAVFEHFNGNPAGIIHRR